MRVCSGMRVCPGCAGVFRWVRMCLGRYGCVRVGAGVFRWVRVGAGGCRGVQVRVGTGGWMRVMFGEISYVKKHKPYINGHKWT